MCCDKGLQNCLYLVWSPISFTLLCFLNRFYHDNFHWKANKNKRAANGCKTKKNENGPHKQNIFSFFLSLSKRQCKLEKKLLSFITETKKYLNATKAQIFERYTTTLYVTYIKICTYIEGSKFIDKCRQIYHLEKKDKSITLFYYMKNKKKSNQHKKMSFCRM